jgi:hypothetical protein
MAFGFQGMTSQGNGKIHQNHGLNFNEHDWVLGPVTLQTAPGGYSALRE